jgi:hypothetical protein
MQRKRLSDGYRYEGFRPYQTVTGLEDAPRARVVRLKRLQKKRNVPNVGDCIGATTIQKRNWSEICHVETCWYTLSFCSDDAGAK